MKGIWMENRYQYQNFDSDAYRFDPAGKTLAESFGPFSHLPQVITLVLALLLLYWLSGYILIGALSPWILLPAAFGLFFIFLGLRLIIAHIFRGMAEKLSMKGKHDYDLWFYHKKLWKRPVTANQALMSMAAIDILMSEMKLSKQALDEIDREILSDKELKIYYLFRLIAAIQSGSDQVEEMYKAYSSISFEENPYQEKTFFPTDETVARWVVGNGYVSAQAQEMRDAVRSIQKKPKWDMGFLGISRGLLLIFLSFPILFTGLDLALFRGHGWYFYPAFGIFGAVISALIVLWLLYHTTRLRLYLAANRGARKQEKVNFSTFRKMWKKRKMPEEALEAEDAPKTLEQPEDAGMSEDGEQPKKKTGWFSREEEDPDSDEEWDQARDREEAEPERKYLDSLSSASSSNTKKELYWSDDKLKIRKLVTYPFMGILAFVFAALLLITAGEPFLQMGRQRKVNAEEQNVTIALPGQSLLSSSFSIYHWSFWYLAIANGRKDVKIGKESENSKDSGDLYFRTTDSLLMQYWPDAIELDPQADQSAIKSRDSSSKNSGQSADSDRSKASSKDSDTENSDTEGNDLTDSEDSDSDDRAEGEDETDSEEGDTDADSSEGTDPVQKAMSLVFQYLKENSPYPNMGLSYGTTAKGDSYAVIGRTTDTQGSASRKVEYQLYVNGSRNSDVIEIVCEKVYDEGMQDAQIMGFYRVDLESESVTDEHRTSW